MIQNQDGSRHDEATANRVTISGNINRLRISIKSNAFALGNNLLTLFLAIGLLGEIALIILLSNTIIDLTVAISAILCLGCITIVLFISWMWHQFGEELINIRGSSIEANRNYGLFSGKQKGLTLNDGSELFVNRTDSWSWLKMQPKGLFRIVSNQETIHFGVSLSDLEYAMVVKHISDHLKKYKTSGQDVLEVTEKTNGKSVTGTNGKSVTGTNGKSVTGTNGKSVSRTNGKSVTGTNGKSVSRTNGENKKDLNGYQTKPTSRNGKTKDVEKPSPNKPQP